jgi:peptidoglycan hydrolase CwlO-like protein
MEKDLENKLDRIIELLEKITGNLNSGDEDTSQFNQEIKYLFGEGPMPEDPDDK